MLMTSSMLSVLKQLTLKNTYHLRIVRRPGNPRPPGTLPDGDTSRHQASPCISHLVLLAELSDFSTIFLINISDSMRTYRYPTVNLWSLIATILTLLPTAWIVILSKCKAKRPVKRSWQLTILAACGLYLPFSFVLSYSVLGNSQTTDIRNYCVLTRMPGK